MDHVDEMIAVNKSIHSKDLIRILLLNRGICDSLSLDGIESADDGVIESFLTEIVISDEFIKLLNYLRM
jgi:hypothetical protein